MSILLASMTHTQPNGKTVKKIDFFGKKIEFLNRKISVFGKKIKFFDDETAFPCTQPQYMLKFLCQTFSIAKQGFPFSIQGCAKPHFHMGIPGMETGTCFFNRLMETGINHFHMGMSQSPFPYGDPCMETFLAPKIFGNAIAPGV